LGLVDQCFALWGANRFGRWGDDACPYGLNVACVFWMSLSPSLESVCRGKNDNSLSAVVVAVGPIVRFLIFLVYTVQWRVVARIDVSDERE